MAHRQNRRDFIRRAGTGLAFGALTTGLRPFVFGQDEAHRITNVIIRNVNILGSQITDLKGLNLSLNEFCEGITVE